MSIIRLQLKDWLYNAGIVGFVNILKHSNDEVEINGQEVIVNSKVLDSFEEKYFNYFIDTYAKSLSWYRIISFNDFLEKHEREDYIGFDEKSLEILNQFIGSASKNGSLKYFLTSNSYKAAYSLISSDFNILKTEKELKQVKLKKGESIKDKIDDVKDAFAKLRDIIEYCKMPDGRKYIAAKNVMYNILKNALNEVSFLYPQTKIPNMYIDYNQYFVEGARCYLNKDNTEQKYNCFTCNSKIGSIDESIGFIKATGFDINRKPSHLWNFTNDIVICPICKLIYSCIPAGFTYVSDKGIFVNENHRIENILRINNKIKQDILNSEGQGIFNAFTILTNALHESINDNIKYELSDIQVVRYEDEKYRFNLLSKNLLNILYISKNELNSLVKARFLELDTYFGLYEQVMRRLLVNENLFSLIHKIIILKISNPQNKWYRMAYLNDLLVININFLKGIRVMENTEKDILKLASGAGYSLKKEYKAKNSGNKLDGISYRLLNALKTNNIHMFMDILLNCYLYTNKTVPQVIIDSLKDDNYFKTVGYAFVAGLIDSDKN